MKTDNLEIILPMLQFESDDDFYFLQILQRRKENPDLSSNSKVIKNYYISSKEYLLSKYEEIKTLCDVFNARACIRLNRRSFEKVGFQALETTVNTLKNKDFKFIKNSYDRACGLSHNEKSNKWIVDVDKEDVIWLEYILNAINSCTPYQQSPIKHVPSKSGIHLITSPFNVMQFKIFFTAELRDYKMDYREIEILKDNPTNLYIA